MAQHGGDPAIGGGGRLPSFALNMDIPEAAARALSKGTSGSGPAAAAPEAPEAAAALQRRNSGLQSMQSIEHALADTQRGRDHGSPAGAPPGSNGGGAGAMHDAMDAAVRAVQDNTTPTLSGSKRK